MRESVCECVCVGSYDVQLEVVSQAGGAGHPHHHGVLQLRTEAHRQSVRPRAGTVVRGPRVGDQTTITTKYVRGSSCRHRNILQLELSVEVCVCVSPPPQGTRASRRTALLTL